MTYNFSFCREAKETQANVGNVEVPKKKKKRKRKAKNANKESTSVDVVQSKQSDITKPSKNENNSEKLNRKRKATDNNHDVPPKKSFKSNSPKLKQERNKKNSFKNSKFKKDRNDSCEFADERLKAYGINPKKYKNKLKYAPKMKNM